MQEYLTLEFKDDSLGRLKMGEAIKSYSKVGWSVMNKETTSQGFSVGKTVALGAIFLPLALLGKKKDKIIITLVREKKEPAQEDRKKQQEDEEFMKRGKVVVPIQADGSILCPECKTKISDYTTRGFIFKTKVYVCSKCNHTVLK